MTTVTPLTPADYSAWHKNRPHFSLWYVSVDDDEVVRYCQQKQAEFGRFLAPDYQRQFHITLFVNGFWQHQKCHDDDFTPDDLNRQIERLISLNLTEFKLNLINLHSFDNCLSIQLDNHDELAKIRHTLAATHPEISPSAYIPHITLGFYGGAFLKQEIFSAIDAAGFKKIPLTVNRLTFGVYRADELQGRLTPIYELSFS